MFWVVFASALRGWRSALVLVQPVCSQNCIVS
jgi:hypothetical protein